MNNSTLKEFLEDIGATTNLGKKAIALGKFSLLIYNYQHKTDDLTAYFDYEEYDMEDILNMINAKVGTNFTDYLKELDNAKYVIKGYNSMGESGFACFSGDYTNPYIHDGLSMEDLAHSNMCYLLAFETKDQAQAFINANGPLKFNGYGKIVKYEFVPLDRTKNTWPFIQTNYGPYMYAVTIFWSSTDSEYERVIGNILNR